MKFRDGSAITARTQSIWTTLSNTEWILGAVLSGPGVGSMMLMDPSQLWMFCDSALLLTWAFGSKI